MTEQLGERATDALHEAIRIAWQAGYDQALTDINKGQDFGGGRILRRMINGEFILGDGE